MSWRDQAACRGMDPDIFCAPRTGPRPWDRARAICDQCPVRWPCRNDALEVEAGAGLTWRYSMRGGLTPAERKEIAGWAELERSWRQWSDQRDRFEMFCEEWTVPA